MSNMPRCNCLGRSSPVGLENRTELLLLSLEGRDVAVAVGFLGGEGKVVIVVDAVSFTVTLPAFCLESFVLCSANLKRLGRA